MHSVLHILFRISFVFLRVRMPVTYHSFLSFILFPSNAPYIPFVLFFFFNDTATPEISPLPLHDALPILDALLGPRERRRRPRQRGRKPLAASRLSAPLFGPRRPISRFPA